MRLKVISDYGATSRLVSEDATVGLVEETMGALDWSGFHQVVLEQRTGEYLEVGGSLDPSDGLSALYEENGRQHLTRTAPTTIGELLELQRAYLAGADRWKALVEWD